MKQIELNQVNDVHELFEALQSAEEEAVIVRENKEEKYAIVPIESFWHFEDLKELEKLIHPIKYGNAEINIIAEDDIEISYDEYEKIKAELLDALDRTFKPKLEKLN